MAADDAAGGEAGLGLVVQGRGLGVSGGLRVGVVGGPKEVEAGRLRVARGGPGGVGQEEERQ